MRARFTARARGPKALVSDERESYTPGAENAGLEHRLGLAHWRKAVARRRKPVEDYETEQQLFETALQRLDELVVIAACNGYTANLAAPARPAGGSVNPPSTPCACSLWTSWRRPLASRWEATASQRDWNRLVCYQQEHAPRRDELGRRSSRCSASRKLPLTDRTRTRLRFQAAAWG